MHLFMLALMASLAIWFNPRLLALFCQAQSLLAASTLALFILCLNIFWLFGSYHIAGFLFSFLSHRRKIAPTELPPETRVAVLYLTSDDFQYEAALSCVQLGYNDFHVFILDDSTDPHRIREVDEFHGEFPDKTTVVRRKGRQGFKAGSLNHALRNHVTDFPYFAVVDADGVLPPDFLTRLMPYFAVESVAFVQGSHRPNPVQKSEFATDLAPGIFPLWSTYYPPRNRYGLVLFLGHGGIVRRDVWELIGGFPEMLAEDLAFSTKVRQYGFQGWFADTVCSYEDFPESYARLRRQQERYIKGGCQYIESGLLKSFLKSPSPTWFEKTDLLLWIATLFLPAMYLFFLLLFTVLMPLSFAESRTPQLSLLGFELRLWPVFSLSDYFQSVWTWDFYFATIVMVLAPVLGSLRRVAQHPWETVKLLFMSSVPYLSMTLVSVVWMTSYFLTRRVDWKATGQVDQMTTQPPEGNGGSPRAGSETSCLNPHILILEILGGAILTIACLLTTNVALLVFSLSLLLGPILQSARRANRALAAALPIPYLLLGLAMGSVGANLWGLQGASILLFPLHF
jgi:cellulose synthase/poly-beta-1,6-N-acetylglucosamine synthase-like glycosyltransferase